MNYEAQRRQQRQRIATFFHVVEWACYAAMVVYGATVFAQWVSTL